MKTSKTRTTRKPIRTVTILEQPTADTDGWGAVKITVNGKSVSYLVRFIPSDFGFGAEGFEIEKLDDDLTTVESYTVHLSERPEDCWCDCRGHQRWSHCKHCDCLKVIGPKFPRLYTSRDHRHDPQQPAEVEGNEPA